MVHAELLYCAPILTVYDGIQTALLSALLGEIDCIEGKVFLPKHGSLASVSYCAQNPFLQQRSIRDNILFGSPFDEERYRAVLSACALTHDLDVLEDGDETEIGVRGIVLSGGQKARVALARSVYSRSQIVLLDDVLAAVDVGTARHLFENCLQGPLLKGRTVVRSMFLSKKSFFSTFIYAPTMDLYI